MAYRIIYADHKKVSEKKGARQVLVVLAVIALALVGHYLGWGQYLIPGDAAVTAGASRQLMDSIGSGEPVREAFRDFCREIIGNGQVW